METAIGRAVGLDFAGRFEAVLQHLTYLPGFLVLDNFETPWEADESATESVMRVLAQLPDLVVVASMRGTEAPKGAQWRVENLAPLNRRESRRLFLQFASGIKKNDPHLDHFLDALAGVPLALELVAKRVGVRTRLDEMWLEWQRIGTRLAEKLRNKGGKNDSLGTSIEFSWRSPRLGESGKRLFALLGQLPAGIASIDRLALLGSEAERADSELLAVGLAQEKDGRLDLLPPSERSRSPPACAPSRRYKKLGSLLSRSGAG